MVSYSFPLMNAVQLCVGTIMQWPILVPLGAVLYLYYISLLDNVHLLHFLYVRAIILISPVIVIDQ